MSGPYFLTISAPFYKNQSGIAYYPQTQTALDSGSQEYSWYGYSRDTRFVNVPQTYVSLTTESVGAPNFRSVKNLFLFIYSRGTVFCKRPSLFMICVPFYYIMFQLKFFYYYVSYWAANIM